MAKSESIDSNKLQQQEPAAPVDETSVGEVGRERGVWWVKVGEGGRREGWGRGDYFLFLKGGTHIF